MGRIANFIPGHSKKVFICAPVKNRAWILPEYLKALENLIYAEHLITFCFILNDSIDNSENMLDDFAQKCNASGQKVAILKRDFGVDEWLREDMKQEQKDNLAGLRNQLVDEFLKTDADYFFSVDTDIIVSPDTLTNLINCDKDIVGSWVFNTDLDAKQALQGYTCNVLKKDVGGTYSNFDMFPENALFQADAVDNIYLVKREVFEKGIRYSYYKEELAGAPGRYSFPNEEVGLCAEVTENGFEIWCHSGIFCEHRMKEISYESMVTLINVLRLKRYLAAEEKQYSALIELVTEQGEVIELGEYNAYEQLHEYRKELINNVKMLESEIQAKQLDLTDYFSNVSPSLALSDLLPVFMEQCTKLVDLINQHAETVSEIDLRNQLLLQKKLMLLENK